MLTWNDNVKLFPQLPWVRSAAYMETALRKCLVELRDEVGLADHHIERISSILAGRLIEEGVQ